MLDTAITIKIDTTQLFSTTACITVKACQLGYTDSQLFDLVSQLQPYTTINLIIITAVYGTNAIL